MVFVDPLGLMIMESQKPFRLTDVSIRLAEAKKVTPNGKVSKAVSAYRCFHLTVRDQMELEFHGSQKPFRLTDVSICW